MLPIPAFVLIRFSHHMFFVRGEATEYSAERYRVGGTANERLTEGKS